MSMRVLLIVVAACFLTAADKAQDFINRDLVRMQGEWSMVSGEIDGTALPEDSVKGARRVTKDDETTVTIDGRVFMKAKFTLDPEKKPRAIDYRMLEGATKGKTQLGIYEFDGDTVKFCFAAPGKDRPTDFTTKEGSGRVLSVWKKAKK
jgi:uncharacterized protein (TIGR03067 family)